jgi:hypothetical protein
MQLSNTSFYICLLLQYTGVIYSVKLFILVILCVYLQEFERLNLHKYKLIKEEDFYFVVTNKMYAALTKALTTALVELSRENTPASQEMIAFTTKELNTSVTYTSLTLMSTEQQKVVSPRSHSSKEEGLSSIPSGKEDELSPLPCGSDESHYMFPKDSRVRSENISRISENNDSNSVSEQDHFSDFYDKLEGVDIPPVKSTDLRSLSAGEIDLKGLKKSFSCAGLLMTSAVSSKDRILNCYHYFQIS